MIRVTKSFITIFFLLFTFACGHKKTKISNETKAEIETKKEAALEDILSAFPKDKANRLKHLKNLIKSKNEDLSLLKKKLLISTDDKNINSVPNLRAETLTNEILLLEAYQYSIEENWDVKIFDEL